MLSYNVKMKMSNMEHFINFDCTNLSEAGGETIFGGEVTTRGDTMRGLIWNIKKDGLMVVKRLQKAIEKHGLLAKFNEEKYVYLTEKLLDLTNKRHTKGYYYALSSELFSILTAFTIMADERTIERVRIARTKGLSKRADQLKQDG